MHSGVWHFGVGHFNLRQISAAVLPLSLFLIHLKQKMPRWMAKEVNIHEEVTHDQMGWPSCLRRRLVRRSVPEYGIQFVWCFKDKVLRLVQGLIHTSFLVNMIDNLHNLLNYFGPINVFISVQRPNFGEQCSVQKLIITDFIAWRYFYHRFNC